MHTIMAVKTIKNTDNNALFSSMTIATELFQNRLKKNESRTFVNFLLGVGYQLVGRGGGTCLQHYVHPLHCNMTGPF